jgi:ATP-dependent helicase HrpA
LPIEPVAQASADQRAGRCGRIGPGVCVRLYSESDYLSRPRYAVPEIRRTHLAAVILRMLALRLGAIEDFPFLDRPKPEAIQEGWQTLRELQAVDAQGGLTPIGERLSRLPVDPRVGRMVLAAIELGCVSEVLIIAAALEIQDPRERPAGAREAAEAKHARFADTRSDFLSYLKLWDYFHELRGQTSHRAFRKACREQFLSFARLREWQEVYRQLRDLVVQAGGTLTPRTDNYAAVHRALLTGLLSSIAVRRGPHDYATPRGDAFFLWPGSGSFARKPKWLVAAEAVETTRKYLRTVASIQREWLEPLAAHLVERTYRGAHWSTRRQAVLAYERVHLFGLSIAPRRTTPFGPIDPALARDVFVREALLHEGLQRRFAFQQHNRQLLEELSAWGAKRRVSHLMADEAALWAFYDARVPSGVYDLETFRRWYHRELRRDPHALLLSREELAPGEPRAESQSFPDQWQCGPAACTLDYRFAPGDADDGVSLSIGRELLPLLSDDQLGWLVPGLLEEKLVALIRLLPKPIRTRLVPAPNVAQALAQRLPFGEGPFLPRVAEAMSRLAGVRVTPDMLPVDKLPPHLRLNVRVVDAAGTVLTQGRSLAELRAWAGLGRGTAGQRYLEHPDWSQSGLTDWTWGDLPPTLELEQGAFRLTGTPGLLDEGRAVALRLFAWAQEAREQTRAGVRRLLLLNRPEAIGQQVKWLPDWPRLRLLAQRIPSQAPFAEEVAELLVDRALGPDAQVPRTQAAYARLTDELEDRLALAVQDVAPLLGPLVERYVEADEALRRLPRRAERTAGADIREQMAELFAPSYLVHTPWEWLQHVPRYLAAISVRIGRLCAGGDLQDARMTAELAPHWERWRDLRDRDPWSRFDLELTRYRWWLEELRVSLFAQQLGTAVKASGKRLDEQWERVGQPGAEAGTN